MADEPIYVSRPEDMAAFDRLPRRLKQFLTEAVIGIPATPVLELYEDKASVEIEGMDPAGEVIQALRQWMKNRGVKDLRPVNKLPGAKTRRVR